MMAMLLETYGIDDAAALPLVTDAGHVSESDVYSEGFG